MAEQLISGNRFSPSVRVAIGGALGTGVLLLFAVACGGGGASVRGQAACGRVGVTAKGHAPSSDKRATASGIADQSSDTDGFGTGGKVFTAVKAPVAGVRALVLQSDGRIVVTPGFFDLIRYTRKGRLDRSFGRGGKVLGDRAAWVGGNGAGSDAMAIQADGKIILAGSVQYGSLGELGFTDFALARYTAEGRLDRSFGKAGEVQTHLERQSTLNISSLALQRDGKILAGGGTSGDSALVRYTANGCLDPSFGRGGTILTFTHAFTLHQIALQDDGKIVVAGTGPTGDKPEGFILARYTPDGKLDPSFGSGGLARTGRFRRPPGEPSYLPEDASPEAVAIRPDGKIVVAGLSSSGIALARFTRDGHLDPSFGHGGMTDDDPQRRFREQNGGVYAAAFQGDGKIVSVGRTVAPHSEWKTNSALVRHTVAGELDTSFGDNGVVLANLGDVSEAYAVAIQRDGKIVAGGSGGKGPAVALARFLPDGRLDS
jgi:uncharacterized delta-60 repeat protein